VNVNRHTEEPNCRSLKYNLTFFKTACFKYYFWDTIRNPESIDYICKN